MITSVQEPLHPSYSAQFGQQSSGITASVALGFFPSHPSPLPHFCLPFTVSLRTVSFKA